VIDLDRFKQVNDSVGIAVGDSILLTLARRLGRLLKPQDTLARLSGDQFALILLSEKESERIIAFAETLRKGQVRTQDLAAVQRRREPPTRKTQNVQLFIQKQIIARVLTATRKLSAPLPLRLLNWFPYLRRFPARFVGLGVQPEHVRTRDAG